MKSSSWKNSSPTSWSIEIPSEATRLSVGERILKPSEPSRKSRTADVTCDQNSTNTCGNERPDHSFSMSRSSAGPAYCVTTTYWYPPSCLSSAAGYRASTDTISDRLSSLVSILVKPPTVDVMNFPRQRNQIVEVIRSTEFSRNYMMHFPPVEIRVPLGHRIPSANPLIEERLSPSALCAKVRGNSLHVRSWRMRNRHPCPGIYYLRVRNPQLVDGRIRVVRCVRPFDGWQRLELWLPFARLEFACPRPCRTLKHGGLYTLLALGPHGYARSLQNDVVAEVCARPCRSRLVSDERRGRFSILVETRSTSSFRQLTHQGQNIQGPTGSDQRARCLVARRVAIGTAVDRLFPVPALVSGDY